jgi:Icc-related predicted phosphoesterase
MPDKIVFCADLHGNIVQYQKAFRHALDIQSSLVIFGGDLCPKEPERRTPKLQREFLTQELFPLIKDFKLKNSSEILMTLGNDDFKSLYPTLLGNQKAVGYQMIEHTPFISKNGFHYIGYAYVPFNPYKYRDFQKRDLASDKAAENRIQPVSSEGVMSEGDELIPNLFEDQIKLSSIEEDLYAITKDVPPEKQILVVHTPPFDTACDLTKHGLHVGSKGLRKYIEDKQPLLALHGHIHETVELSGKFPEYLGSTICVSAGNDHKPLDPFIVEIEIGKEIIVQRKRLNET